AAIRESSPVALTLTGATNEYQTVARIKRYAPLSGNSPPVAPYPATKSHKTAAPVQDHDLIAC
ncbi:hypothetical protein ABLV66_20405, partial [Klebsiella sp. CN_Kp073]